MRYFFNFIITCFFLLCCTAYGVLRAQNFPVYNSYYVNPFLYNPAEALTEYAQVFALHRQQWMNIEGAPTVSALTFNTLLNESRAGLGGKFSSYQRGLLNTTDFQIAYAYGVPMGQKNWLFLGLSAGAITNSIDITQVSDPNDPAIANYLANNIQPAAGFGALYRSGSGLNVGVSLPQLFPNVYNSNASFSNTTVSPADNVFVTIYYKRKVESKIASRRQGGLKRKVRTQETVAPLEIYFNYKYSKFGNSQFEFLGKLNITQNFWLGGSYRLPYGWTGNLGINTQRFIFGYSYEPNNQPADGFSQGSHEVILGLKLGSLKKFKRAAPVLRSTLTKSPNEKHTARFQDTANDPDKINNDQEAAKKRYFVVIRLFNDFTQADAFKKKLIGDKFNAEIFYNPQDKKYYVHVLETLKASEAHEEIRNLKTYTKLKDARLLIVTSDK
jgi:type IX secretion system PorP/SprF family membrane protein